MRLVRSLAFVFVILTVLASLLPAGAMQQPEITGALVYTANAFDTNEDGIIDEADNDIMFSVEIGADPEDGRFHIAGGPPASAAYPRLSSNGEIVLCHAFADSNGDGIVDHETDMPYMAAVNADGTDLTLFTERGAVVALDAVWSPDERSIAFSWADTDTNGDGAVTIADTLRLVVLELGGSASEVSTTSELATDQEVQVLTDDTISVIKPQYWNAAQIIFEAVLVEDGSQAVYVYNLETDELTQLSPEGVNAGNPQVIRDGTLVAMEVETEDGPQVWVYDVETETVENMTPEGVTGASSPSWSPEGDWLAMAVATDMGNEVVVVEGGDVATVTTTEAEVTQLTVSPDGQAVAFAATAEEDGPSALVVASVAGGFAATMTPEDSDLVDLTWAPAEAGEASTSLPSPAGIAMNTIPVGDLPRSLLLG